MFNLFREDTNQGIFIKMMPSKLDNKSRDKASEYQILISITEGDKIAILIHPRSKRGQ
ncbi:hypothetical protein OO013_07960 [Mangrovivirga sp. M17]|uniref:Uncharacterized protein n=1 Tax=Mangrovivirga halotolerans TaxID=2993936 RepID=A0ABT3RPR7_9BACT|nr:hypothetical protein [Mangrovivirga halotolerans]MCX2743795.1 hypothetical protein [Mangrovivirga halotolerans]